MGNNPEQGACAALFLADQFAGRILDVANGAPQPTLVLLGAAFGFKFAVVGHFPDLFLDGPRRFFEAALDPLLVHGHSPKLSPIAEQAQRMTSSSDSGTMNFFFRRHRWHIYRSGFAAGTPAHPLALISVPVLWVGGTVLYPVRAIPGEIRL